MEIRRSGKPGLIPVQSIQRYHRRPVQKMVFVPNHDPCGIQFQVAIQRETWVNDTLGKIKNEPRFQALARPNFRIEIRVRWCPRWGTGIHSDLGYLIDPARSINEYALAANFPLRPATRPVGDANVNKIEGSAGTR